MIGLYNPLIRLSGNFLGHLLLAIPALMQPERAVRKYSSSLMSKLQFAGLKNAGLQMIQMLQRYKQLYFCIALLLCKQCQNV